MGRRQPVTTRDVIFTWEVGRHPQSGVMPKEFYRSLYRIDATDDRTFTLHFDKRHFNYNAIDSLELLPAHRARSVRRTGSVSVPHALRHAADQQGLYNGPYVISEVIAGSHVRPHPESAMVGGAARVFPNYCSLYRQHRYARGEPIVRRHRHDRGRNRPEP